MIAKALLPLLGGGSSVWAGCLLFFQSILLAGYGYAHALTKLASIRQQVSVHSLMLMIALISTWTVFNQPLALVATNDPLHSLLLSLIMIVGVPYFAVATTGPLIQSWIAKTSSYSPYRYYALSNIGSLLALLAYPFLLEPSLSLPHQALLWSGLFTVFTLLFVIYFYILNTKQLYITGNGNLKPNLKDTLKIAGQDPSMPQLVTSFAHKALWVLFSAAGVIALVSTTSAMTQNIPPVPFLWILPLALYLVSFIITFHKSTWYVRWYWIIMLLISSMIALFMFFIASQFDMATQIVLYSLILFSICMVCHGELFSLKPDSQNLTLFYVYLALGGVIGSAFVNFVAVEIFTSYYEFLLAGGLTGFLLVWRLSLTDPNLTYSNWVKAGFQLSICVIFVVLFAGFVQLSDRFNQTDVVKTRNFYGILTVKEVSQDGKKERRLIDGSTSHGTQSLDEASKKIPKSYYRTQTAIGQLLMFDSGDNIKLGVIGLGTGALAAYGRSQDQFVFYELNPDVDKIAHSHFSYLADSKAQTQVILGDARLSLHKQWQAKQNQQFDVLVIDAFSGDSIPMHLLTEEAIALYLKHMSNSGVIAFHISNSHIDLTPVIESHARRYEQSLWYVKTPANNSEQHDAIWVLMTEDQSLSSRLNLTEPWPTPKTKVTWTDAYSDLLSVLK